MTAETHYLALIRISDANLPAETFTYVITFLVFRIKNTNRIALYCNYIYLATRSGVKSWTKIFRRVNDNSKQVASDWLVLPSKNGNQEVEFDCECFFEEFKDMHYALMLNPLPKKRTWLKPSYIIPSRKVCWNEFHDSSFLFNWEVRSSRKTERQ